MTRALILCCCLLLSLAARSTHAPSVQAPSLASLARASLSQLEGTIRVPGLKQDVQVLRDQWGVPHIYAQSTEDLFFAQGYVLAQDRLWQMEMWRREAEGKLAEVLGAGALPRDRQARLLKYRGPVDDRELTTYHPEARRIMTAYVAGVNAFIAAGLKSGKLPVEFVLTGIRPEPWTIDTLLLRQTSLGDGTAELQLARTVAQQGA